MKRLIVLLGMALSLGNAIAQQAYNVRAPFDPATVKVAENMRGEVLKFQLDDSHIYPGTEREILVYVPQQYVGDQPACLLVCMDGILYDATTVMDNLIASGEMPVTVGVFVNPGVVYDEEGEVVRYNRCKEFDSTDDSFATFLENEVLAKVEGMQTESGKTIRLSKDANDRAITGASSGGIAAFTAAWSRPDLYSRVYTTVGTFVAMRGGHEYPAIVRKTEPKPLRIYMQDGWYDVWNPIFGEWFEYNLLMESAFNFAGYEVFHHWNRGNHSIKYGTLAFPDAMRWLWKGYPARVQKGWSNNGILQDILLKDEDWQEIPVSMEIDSDLFATADSSIVFSSQTMIYKVSPAGACTHVGAMKTGERLMGCGLTARGTTLYHKGTKVADGLSGLQAVLPLDGDRYLALCNDRAKSKPNVWVVSAGSRALAIAPDYRFCVTGEDKTHHLLSTIVSQQGEMLYSEPFYYLHDMSNGVLQPAGNMAFDTKGNLYVATEMGVQVADHNGRVRAILSLPAGGVQSLAFSGNYLYVLCGNRLFVRKMNAEGHLPANGKVTYKSQGQG
jgi:enterochelin esterase-like enzyme